MVLWHSIRVQSKLYLRVCVCVYGCVSVGMDICAFQPYSDFEIAQGNQHKPNFARNHRCLSPGLRDLVDRRLAEGDDARDVVGDDPQLLSLEEPNPLLM